MNEDKHTINQLKNGCLPDVPPHGIHFFHSDDDYLGARARCTCGRFTLEQFHKLTAKNANEMISIKKDEQGSGYELFLILVALAIVAFFLLSKCDMMDGIRVIQIATILIMVLVFVWTMVKGYKRK